MSVIVSLSRRWLIVTISPSSIHLRIISEEFIFIMLARSPVVTNSLNLRIRDSLSASSLILSSLTSRSIRFFILILARCEVKAEPSIPDKVSLIALSTSSWLIISRIVFLRLRFFLSSFSVSFAFNGSLSLNLLFVSVDASAAIFIRSFSLISPGITLGVPGAGPSGEVSPVLCLRFLNLIFLLSASLEDSVRIILFSGLEGFS